MAKSGVLTVKVVGDTQNFEKKMGGLGPVAKVAGAAVAAGIAAGAAKSLTSFVGFERQMNEVFTLLPGISDEAMGKMTGQVKQFSKDFGVLPDKVVPALYQSLSAGVPPDNVFEFLETAQKAAKGGVTDLTTAVDGISSVVNAYGDDVIDATKASDLMFTAVRLGKTNFEELSTSLSNVTPISSALGVKFEDVAAAMATMTAKGIPTAQATTQMRSLFTELSKEGGKAAKTFEDMAGKSFQDFIAEGGNTADALDVMKDAAAASDVELQDLFSSVEAGGAALALASDDSFVKNLDEMGSSAGATEKAFTQMDKGLGPVFDKMKAAVAVLAIDIGEKLAPVLLAISEWAMDNAPVVMVIAGLIGGALVAAFVAWAVSAAAAAVATIAAAAPIIALGLAVAGVVTAIVLFIKNWSEIWAEVKEITSEVVSAVVDFVKGLPQRLLDGLKGAWDLYWTYYIGVWLKVAEYVGDRIVDVVDFIKEMPGRAKDALTAAWSAFAEKWSGVWSAVMSVVSGAVGEVVGFVRGLPGKLLEFAGDMLSAGSSLGSKFLDGLKNGLTAAASFAGDIAAGIVSVVKNAWNTVAGMINRFVPNSIGFGPFKLDLPDNPIPTFAKGIENFEGGLAYVHKGEVLANLPRGTDVIPKHKVNAAMGGGGDTYIINMSTTFGDRQSMKRAAEELRRELLHTQRRNPGLGFT